MMVESRLFADRRQAGVEVAKRLDKYRGTNPIVLGIPRGGVVIAHEIAKRLNGELSVLITKKLSHPGQEEVTIGSVAEDGSTFLSSLARDIERDTITGIVVSQLKEIKRRVQLFRKGRQLPEMFNRTVIIADDGIATGSTIVPAIKLCKSRKAARVIVAAPVSGRKYVSQIDDLADEVVIAEIPFTFSTVGQNYNDFHHISDDEVVALLAGFENAKH